MSRDVVTTGKIAKPAGPFSAAVRRDGLVFVSGQIAQDPTTGALREGDAAVQAEQVLRNLTAVVEAAGRSLDDVIRVGVYLRDMDDFAAVNAVYERFFTAPYPARTAIGVAALPLGAVVEMDAVVG
ncbi:Rid family detoxifying hydrolase [Microbispora sp. NPDC049125]|uniref:Rid family detoxifying hydrolase n=1 Tax=Microbispora sp. NPDC049125 TaxID=3154929 RepID=UPI003466AE80